MSGVCAKPGCTGAVEAWFLTSRDACEVVISAVDAPHAIGLCSSHLARLTVPGGWTLTDSRKGGDPARSAEPKSAGTGSSRRPWFAPDSEPHSAAELVETIDGTMLSRAFRGPSSHVVTSADELEARRLVRFERIEDQVDRAPQRPRHRQEQQGKHDGESDRHDEQPTDPDIGRHEERAGDEHDQQQGERHDRVDTDRSDELPFPPFEAEVTSRAALG